MIVDVSQQELEAAHCWLDHDRVPGRPELTEFRRVVRYHNARWREVNGYPIGTHRTRPGDAASPGRQPPRPRVRTRERRDLPHREGRGGRSGPYVVRRAAPDLRSPGLLGRPALLRSAGDQPVRRPRRRRRPRRQGAPHLVARDSRSRYRRALRALARTFRPELLQQPPLVRRLLRTRPPRRFRRSARDRRQVPRSATGPWREADALPRFVEIHERSKAFARDAVDKLNASPLSVAWLEHLLLLSMLQHNSGRWTWGRYVVVHPDGNTDIAHATDQYRTLLADDDLHLGDDRRAALGQGAGTQDRRRAASPLPAVAVRGQCQRWSAIRPALVGLKPQASK